MLVHVTLYFVHVSCSYYIVIVSSILNTKVSNIDALRNKATVDFLVKADQTDGPVVFV